MSRFAPELDQMLSVVAASLDEGGTLLEANAGFLRLIEAPGLLPDGTPVAQFFIQPDFRNLVDATASADGQIHDGLLTLGNFNGRTRSLRGRVWRDGRILCLLAEYDIEELERLNDTVLALNQDYAKAQFELAQVNLRMQHLNAELEQRVAQRTQALRVALVGAETASRAKSTFLANMSHELRTPLNAILGIAFLVSRKLAEPGLREQVEKIADAGKHLLSMVNQLLDVSRIESGDTPVESADFSLAGLLHSSTESLQQRAAAKGLVLVTEVKPGLPATLRGDAARLGQILTNLLDNSIKFSHQGRICLTASLAEPRNAGLLVKFEVEDQGIGISPEQQAMVFDAFAQADDSTTRRYGGAGLGLAVCKHLTTLMGGVIGVRSVPGHGSTFWFTACLLQGEHAPSAVPAESVPMAAPTETAWAGDSAPVAGIATGGLDDEAIRNVLSQLDALMEQSNTEAIALFEAHAESLLAALGPRGDSLARQIRQFAFDDARQTLHALR